MSNGEAHDYEGLEQSRSPSVKIEPSEEEITAPEASNPGATEDGLWRLGRALA